MVLNTLPILKGSSFALLSAPEDFVKCAYKGIMQPHIVEMAFQSTVNCAIIAVHSLRHHLQTDQNKWSLVGIFRELLYI